jgi:fucose permease
MIQHGIVLPMLGAVLPHVMRTFSISESQAGLLLGIGSLGFMGAPLVAGAIVDRYGIRPALAMGLAVEMLALTGFGLAPVFAAALALGFLVRFGAGFVETSVNVIPTVLPSRSSAEMMNLIHLFFGVGALIAPIMAGVIVRATSNWRFAYMAAALITAGLLAWVSVSRLPKRQTTDDEEPPRGGLLTLLRSPVVLLGGLTLFLYVGAEVGTSGWIVYYLQVGRGFSTLRATSALTIMWFAIMAGRYLNSLLARHVAIPILVLGAGAGGLASGILLPFVATPLPAYAVLFVYGVTISGVFPNVVADVNGRDPARAGAVTGILAICAAAGAMVMQPLIGLAAETLGIRVGIAIPAVLMGVVGAIYWTGLRRAARRRLA